MMSFCCVPAPLRHCALRDHDFTSERNEEFYQISVEVKGMGTLQKSLDDYVKVRDMCTCISMQTLICCTHYIHAAGPCAGVLFVHVATLVTQQSHVVP